MKKMNENEVKKVKVELTDVTGHVAMELTQADTLDLIEQNSGHWVFAGGRLVSAAELADADWSEMAENETTVQLTPGLVGGI
jgi:hypothetical protein